MLCGVGVGGEKPLAARLAVLVVIPVRIHQPSATSRIIITENPAMVAMVTRSMFASFR